jgi:hypothetical protein
MEIKFISKNQMFKCQHLKDQPTKTLISKCTRNDYKLASIFSTKHFIYQIELNLQSLAKCSPSHAHCLIILF